MSEPAVSLYLDQPQKWLNENEMRKQHWSVRRSLTEYWRQMSFVKGRSAWKRKPPMARVRVVATLSWPDNRRRDAANWYPTIKACIDGLVDAGVIEDDSNKHVVGLTIKSAMGQRAIRLTVYEENDG